MSEITDPLVSICCITYNHGQHISQAIEGFLNQKTKFPFEIIIGEDESQDETRQLCIDYAKRYPEIIRVFLRSRKDVIYVDGMPTGRFNFIETMKAARGKYIALCEGDDYWTDPLKLQKQVDFLEAHTDCTLSFHAVNIFDDRTKQFTHVSRPADTKQIYSIHDFLKPESGSLIRLSSVVLRATVVENYPDWATRHTVGDYPLYLLCAHLGNLGYIDKIMSVYRISTSGVWSTKYKEPDYAERHVLSAISMLNEFNKYTNHIYNETIRIKIKWRWHKFINMYTSQKTRRLGKTFFWRYRKHLLLSQQANLFFKLFFPRLYQRICGLYNSWTS
jgi:glycosyltransferase involved in cell wall biosynthesis